MLDIRTHDFASHELRLLQAILLRLDIIAAALSPLVESASELPYACGVEGCAERFATPQAKAAHQRWQHATVNESPKAGGQSGRARSRKV